MKAGNSLVSFILLYNISKDCFKSSPMHSSMKTSLNIPSGSLHFPVFRLFIAFSKSAISHGSVFPLLPILFEDQIVLFDLVIDPQTQAVPVYVKYVNLENLVE